MARLGLECLFFTCLHNLLFASCFLLAFPNLPCLSTVFPALFLLALSMLLTVSWAFRSQFLRPCLFYLPGNNRKHNIEILLFCQSPKGRTSIRHITLVREGKEEQLCSISLRNNMGKHEIGASLLCSMTRFGTTPVAMNTFLVVGASVKAACY